MDENLRIAISCDHAGKKLSLYIIENLKENFSFLNLLPTQEGSVDYPDFAHKLCERIKKGDARYGILVCGSGIGMSMAANRHEKIRAARVHDQESVIMTRKHNDANVLCLGERMIGKNEAIKLVKTFLSTDFEGDRHQKRINKIEID
tara:strand:+ start:7669 stop:8109 length:441 start_codon:yes stop_codon:yes gene_type:complete